MIEFKVFSLRPVSDAVLNMNRIELAEFVKFGEVRHLNQFGTAD